MRTTETLVAFPPTDKHPALSVTLETYDDDEREVEISFGGPNHRRTALVLTVEEAKMLGQALRVGVGVPDWANARP